MSTTDRLSLFSAQGSNASGTGAVWQGGRGIFAAWGTFGSGTCKLQWSPDGGTTYIDADRSGDTYVTFTANGVGEFDLPRGYVRAVLSGATAPSVSAMVSNIG